eukprot:CAMPEP_0194131820 /NCGR_PEP_ID=MMETSP0152-20130528/2481_1 /TAXON_ID=1049557 /ORGANISM="Thalassiothrix antarctica, Strain L6-D1" /LENGTH=469 /DNA_ID=CAMNT_0038826701 /DNA_START=313 /DNA_END=1722 /DNA_ORIENTATION=-
MVFDFFKKRSEEGFEQLNNLAESVKKGQLVEGLRDVAEYTSVTNEKFAQGLAKSRDRLKQNLELLLTGEVSEDVMEDLLDVLLQADLGMSTSEDIVKEVQSLIASQDSKKFLQREELMSVLRGKLIEALDTGKSGSIQFSEDKSVPTVLFIMGANGMGKTTTIGKLAHRLRTEGNQTVLMAACDTFRAGAVEQLQQWAERAEVDCYGPIEGENQSPSSVLYGALDKAVTEKYDTLLVDTSGRLSNNYALTQELDKMKRIIQKYMSKENDQESGKPVLNTKVPHETLLVIDAAQGRMALDSAKVWDEEIGLTGLILTKLDGSARGGSVVAVSQELKLPVKLIGVGEGIEDLRDFAPDTFVDGLLGIGEAFGGTSNDEAELLEARLIAMRRERDAATKEKNNNSTNKGAASSSSGAEAQTTMMDMEGITPLNDVDITPLTDAQPNNNTNNRRKTNNSKNKNKKKKKKKRKK